MIMMLNSQRHSERFLDMYRSRHQAVIFNRPRTATETPATPSAFHNKKVPTKFRSLNQRLYSNMDASTSTETTTNEETSELETKSTRYCEKCSSAKQNVKHAENCKFKLKAQPIMKQKIIDFSSKTTNETQKTEVKSSNLPQSLFENDDQKPSTNKCHCGFEDLKLKKSATTRISDLTCSRKKSSQSRCSTSLTAGSSQEDLTGDGEKRSHVVCDEDDCDDEEIFNIYSRLSASFLELSPLNSPGASTQDCCPNATTGLVLLKDISNLKELNDELEKVVEEDENFLNDDSKSNAGNSGNSSSNNKKAKCRVSSSGSSNLNHTDYINMRLMLDSSDDEEFENSSNQKSNNSSAVARKLDNKSATTTNSNSCGVLLNSSLVNQSHLNAATVDEACEMMQASGKKNGLRISRTEKLQRPHSAFDLDEEFSAALMNFRASLATPSDTTFSSLSNFNSVSRILENFF